MIQMRVIIIQISLIIYLTPAILFSQQLTEKKKVRKESTFGFITGLYLSMLGQGSYEMYTSYSNVTDKNFKPGFNIGSFLEFNLLKHFAIEPEINYSFNKLHIIYTYNDGQIRHDADYILSYSVIQFSIIPKFLFGKKLNMQFFLGPYYSIPLNCQRKGQIYTTSRIWTPVPPHVNTYIQIDNEIESKVKPKKGVQAGLRMDFPLKKNILGVEFRLGRDLEDMTSDPNSKETSVNIGILYKWKLKQKHTDLDN